ncbi:Rrf2 family transcriptional regulator [Bacillus sp. FJAT-27916]|uniref:RrF2 family transcriptional regulator n=1 Tax=Bacillaceae TaxID=186817 RepID=UPI000670ECBE|nr:Rrf2 family transcriptional regulator [Bacillus sp. FJAT-27916]KMY46205.1 Rrf2 family transcriptional regulator [Bacillus sp. FJAT-27916]
MRLTSYTDYSIRVLMYLSADTHKLVNIKDIAAAYGISKNHLTKIIYHLGKLGYIETIRGRNGGIRLAIDPMDINIGELVRKTEEDFAIVECFTSDDHCPISPVCSLRSILNQALLAFIGVLDAYSLEDISRNKGMLLKMLQQSAPSEPSPNDSNLDQ